MENLSVNIIHDNRLMDRYEPLINELFVQGIKDYKIWSPVEDTSSVVASINKSHKQIVRWAQSMKLPMVCIMEDDVMFPSKDGWQFFLSNLPGKFDLYLACTYLPRHAGQLVGLHCYIVHEQFYDRFLEIPDDVHVDTEISNRGGDFKFCYPFPALQRKGWSSNNHAVCDYNSNLTKEDIYYGDDTIAATSMG